MSKQKKTKKYYSESEDTPHNSKQNKTKYRNKEYRSLDNILKSNNIDKILYLQEKF
jgi:hypothetical protein